MVTSCTDTVTTTGTCKDAARNLRGAKLVRPAGKPTQPTGLVASREQADYVNPNTRLSIFQRY
jgi:hypothetical protein